uniref:Uncharacterized protein n=1 Tax=Pithovirus LCPAC406 TaxID=2506599 RepID=A0A481ZEN5_9VIRU|nr:MAG: uncharacterized protein LCPAC406_01590 [Pithovirus LCPAC406]
MLSRDILRKTFLYLTVKETSLILRTNTKFNITNDYLLKNQILNEFGVEKMYMSTWKDTAKFLIDVNMINVKKRWIDGRTYEQILSDSLESKEEDYFYKLRLKHEMFVEFDELSNDIYEELIEDFGPLNVACSEIEKCALENYPDIDPPTREFTVISQVYAYMKSDKSITNFFFSDYADDIEGPIIYKYAMDIMLPIMRFSYICINDFVWHWRRYRNFGSPSTIAVNENEDVPWIDDIWINDVTYRSLLLDNDSISIMKVWNKAECGFLFINNLWSLEYIEEYLMEELGNEEYEFLLTNSKQKKVITNELKVIIISIFDIKEQYRANFDNFFRSVITDEDMAMNRKISSLIDPLLYVKSYNAFRDDQIDILFGDIYETYASTLTNRYSRARGYPVI